MKDCKPQSTPMVTRQVNNRSEKRKIEESEINSDLQAEEIKRVPYKEAIGSLMYLSNATRPNITFTVNYFKTITKYFQIFKRDIKWRFKI